GGESSPVKFRLEKIDVWLVENQVKDAEVLVEVRNRWSVESWTLEAPITCV
ncbi:hypothetical protein L195_g058209, partial [Trifolium pratense]